MKMRCNHPSQVRYSEGIHSTSFYIKVAQWGCFVLAVRKGRLGGVWPGGVWPGTCTWAFSLFELPAVRLGSHAQHWCLRQTKPKQPVSSESHWKCLCFSFKTLPCYQWQYDVKPDIIFLCWHHLEGDVALFEGSHLHLPLFWLSKTLFWASMVITWCHVHSQSLAESGWGCQIPDLN